MRELATALIVVVVGCASVPARAFDPPTQSSSPVPAKVESLAWLAGCWTLEGGEPGAGEVWMPPAAGTLVGVSRSVRNGRTVGWELMRIQETAAGSLEFVAQPSQQQGGSFPLVHAGVREVRFENPGHDFPQRVLYRLDDQGMLQARIEGRHEGKEIAIDFPMRQVPCGAASKSSD